MFIDLHINDVFYKTISSDDYIDAADTDNEFLDSNWLAIDLPVDYGHSPEKTFYFKAPLRRESEVGVSDGLGVSDGYLYSSHLKILEDGTLLSSEKAFSSVPKKKKKKNVKKIIKKKTFWSLLEI
jgi:hypothetical protein